jgi:nucleotide-binding universal stress UspA family protein
LKTILVYIQNAETADQHVEAALSLARVTSAHLTCLRVTPDEAEGGFAGLGRASLTKELLDEVEEDASRLRERLEARLSREDVTWDHIQVSGSVATEIVHNAALADLVVVGREARSDFGAPAITLLGDLLKALRTPLFLPATSPVDPTGDALIAWDGSYEAANAVRCSVGLLKLASSVRVLHFTAKPDLTGTFPGTRLVEFLSRHGIHAELTVESFPDATDDEFIAAGLSSRAISLNAAYVVMGGYGHSRVRQFLLGGVTRKMLSSSRIPIVISS